MAIIILTIIALGFVFSDVVMELDYSVANWIGQFRTNSGVGLFNLLTKLGSSFFVLFLSLVLSYFLWTLPLSGTSYLRVFWFTFLSSAATGYFFKYFIGRDRPLGAELYESSYSFPSGHALTSLFFYGFISFIIFRFSKLSGNKKYAIIFCFMSLILLIGASRLYLGVHYISDVVGGYLIGWFWLNTALYFMKDIQRERKLNVVKVSS